MCDVDELLKYIQKIANLLYLSDLRSSNFVFDERAKQKLLEIPSCAFTFQTWEKAAEYILQTSQNFSTIEEIKTALLCKK